MKQQSRKEILTSAVVLIIYAVGVAGISIPVSRDLFIKLIPAVIILSLAVCLAFHRPGYDLKTATVFLAIIIISWAVEAAGVSSGKIFGRYSYGPSLGTKFMETPLLIGLNWLLLVYGSASIVQNAGLKPVTGIIAAALMMVVYDLILEQVAPSLGMWQFEGETVPFRNYLAWFILSLLFHSLVRFSKLRITNRIAPLVFTVQLLFFILILIISSLR